MNRPLLLLICDFLLLSLLAVAKFDVAESAQQQEETPPPEQGMPEYEGAEEDLVEILTFVLEEERQNREQISQELQLTQEQLQARDEQLSEKAQELSQREKELNQLLANLQEKEQQTEELAEQKQQLEKEYASTQQNMQELQQRLKSTTVEASISKGRLTALEEELKKREQNAQQLQEKLATLEQEQAMTEAEKAELSQRLKETQAQSEFAQTQVTNLRSEIKTVRNEKEQIQQHATKLAEGVTSLSQKSEELAQEIRANRTLSPNAIFTQFLTNRLQSHFVGSHPRSIPFLPGVEKESSTQSILATDGSRIYAVYHIRDTPLELWEPGTDWHRFTGVVKKGNAAYSVGQVGFLDLDPRLLVVPVGETQSQALNAKIYSLSKEPFQHQEAVLVSAEGDGYGEIQFKLDPSHPQYVRMESSLFNRIVGSFSPGTGDLVFSKTGDLLGIMVNNQYCAVITDFTFLETIRCGSDVESQNTGSILGRLRRQINRLPFQLQ